jgi:hypothetical protein
MNLCEFDYRLIDDETADFLKLKENKMRDITGKAYTDLGRELKESQLKLAGNNQYDGVFEKWYTSLGFKKQTVYNLMQRYELLVQNSEKQNVIESLPLTLSYEISKPSANQEIKQKVLEGEVKSLQEYKDLEKALKDAESEKQYWQKQANQLKNLPPRIETKVVTPSDYDDLKQQAITAQQLNNDNVVLQRKIREMQHEFSEKITRHDENNNNAKKLRESLKTLLSAVNQENYNAKFYFRQIEGNPQAHQAVEAFLTEFGVLVNDLFKEWKEQIEITAS